MKFCSHCGQQIDDNAAFCAKCGCAIEEGSNVQTKNAKRENIYLAVLGFILPIIGLIVYIANASSCPQKAKSAGRGALMGFVLLPPLIYLFYLLVTRVIIG